MKTIELTVDAPDRSIPVDRRYATHLMQAGLSESAENELIEGYARCRRNGYVSWHTGVLHANHGSRVRREVIGYLGQSGAFRKSRRYLPQSHCNEYVFADEFNPETTPPTLCKKRATYSTPLCLSPIPFPPSLSYPLSLSISSDWRVQRNRKWVALCQANKWTIPVDYFGDSVICRAVFRALEQLELSGDWVLDDLCPVRVREDRLSPREAGRSLLRKARSGKVIRKLRIKNNTCYHFASNMPRAIRRHCMFGAEAIAESDIPSSYMCHLAGQMPEQDERRRLIDMLPHLYEWIDDVSPRKFEKTDDGDKQQVEFDSLPMEKRRDEVKKQVQRQLLFGIDWRVRARPMWIPFRREFPLAAAMIGEKRKRWGGASGFARYLMRLQGDTLNAAMLDMIDQDITMLPLSDGLIVPEPCVERAAAAIENAAEQSLGFRPLVREK